MGLYIEREGSPITFDEWLAYINNDDELTLSEAGTAINPITKARMTFKIPGRAIWNEHSELTYDNGIIRGEGADIDSLTKKLFEIASALSASVFDCGERLGV
ncbi:MAG: hypothetical protein K2N56_11850 [Oscillospiraceae bacterium]|nr:hypothetical protein [Oscillospiraceae bacterium]